MIVVNVIHNKKNKIVGLKVKGHANSGPHGHDLVCAGVSAIVTGGINALDEKGDYEIIIFEGYTRLSTSLGKKTFSKHDQIVVETMVAQIKTIVASYPDNVMIKDTCDR